MKKKLLIFGISIISLFVLISFSLVIYFRNYYYEGNNVSYEEFIARDDYWKKYVAELTPQNAENICYKINITGFLFELSFQLPKDKVDEFLNGLSKNKTNIRTKIQNNIIVSPFGTIAIADGFFEEKNYFFGAMQKTVMYIYDSSNQRIYLISK